MKVENISVNWNNPLSIFRANYLKAVFEANGYHVVNTFGAPNLSFIVMGLKLA